MHTMLSLTVAESKRLIARGVAQSSLVQEAMAEGTLAIASGTTNSYIVEEILGEKIDKTKCVTGRTLPSDYDGPELTYSRPDLVIRKGKRLDVSAAEAVQEMGPGDVFIKGANAVNPELNQAAVLIGHPTGGTVGATLGTVIARRIALLLPVGLEKSVSGDLIETAELVVGDNAGEGPTLWVVPGTIFTELEALELLSGAYPMHVAAGGVGGAEGAVWLAVYGDKEELNRARSVIDSVRGEPPFVS